MDVRAVNFSRSSYIQLVNETGREDRQLVQIYYNYTVYIPQLPHLETPPVKQHVDWKEDGF